MPMTTPRPQLAALIAVVGVLSVWLVAVAIRAWRGVHIDLVAEMTVVGGVAAALYGRIAGRRSDGDGES